MVKGEQNEGCTFNSMDARLATSEKSACKEVGRCGIYIYIYIYIYIGEPFDEIDHTGALSPQTHNTRTPTSNLTYESTLGLPTKYVY